MLSSVKWSVMWR